MNMFWSYPLVVVVMLATSVAVAQSATSQTSPSSAAPTQTATVTIAPPMIDFGVIKPGSRQKGEFKIQNRGQTAITIESAFPSCKCTTLSDIAGKIIQPGGDLELLASLDAPRTPGEKDAKVFVKIMSVEQPLIAKMQGVVQLPLLIQPVFIDALKGKSKGVVEITNPSQTPFRILSCDGVAPQFVDFDPIKDAPRASYRVRWDFSMIPDGKLQQWWCVQTDVADCPIVPFRIRHESTGIRFDPKMDERRWFIPESIVIAGKISPNKPVELEVEIESSVTKGKTQPTGWDTIRSVQSLDANTKTELISSKREGDRVRVQFRLTVLKSNNVFVYAPIAIVTETGTGRCFVAAVVEP